MSITIDNLTFAHVHYDPDGDVLYLTTQVPDEAVDFDAAGEIVGITLVSPRHLLERDGKVTITLPHHVEVGSELAQQFVVAA